MSNYKKFESIIKGLKLGVIGIILIKVIKVIICALFGFCVI
jgi:hypothetical protein